jgi:hypothetical protein
VLNPIGCWIMWLSALTATSVFADYELMDKSHQREQRTTVDSKLEDAGIKSGLPVDQKLDLNLTNNLAPLTLEQVRALEEGRSLTAATERSRREVLNYFAGLRFIEKRHAGEEELDFIPSTKLRQASLRLGSGQATTPSSTRMGRDAESEEE